ncbi:MAG: hypothetical protein ACPGUE_06715 [Marinomonas sp.]|jgi:hypothetical protein|uniref:hypothetical protein n=1 Tax=unclassified Marinomonas TaxID=196814 RepID=UPI0005FA70ED|nr:MULTISPECIES: hypothetical protein [unclassified Marinomonas]KJZ13269.1 hypothetical protein TW85_13665 [Marinomonas sp. S3726]KZM45760.1 hypothetical protein OA92_00695 [Marinomonas sp. SBI22]KZM46278.1 hypothetical protein OA91_04840 [Marinomonas sp. SBI8L]
MANKFEPVQADDFMKFGGERPSYLLIEDELMALGGLGVTGNQFKKEVLKAAGWTGGALTTYAQRPAVAAASFNKIREILEKGVADGGALKASLEG